MPAARALLLLYLTLHVRATTVRARAETSTFAIEAAQRAAAEVPVAGGVTLLDSFEPLLAERGIHFGLERAARAERRRHRGQGRRVLGGDLGLDHDTGGATTGLLHRNDLYVFRDSAGGARDGLLERLAHICCTELLLRVGHCHVDLDEVLAAGWGPRKGGLGVKMGVLSRHKASDLLPSGPGADSCAINCRGRRGRCGRAQ